MITQHFRTKSSTRRATSLRNVITGILLLLFTLATLAFAQSPSNIFVTGATPASSNSGYNATTDYSVVYANQTYNYNNSGTSSAPDYCQTPANQSRPECQGVVNNNYYTNTNYTNTGYTNTGYTSTTVPSYCSNSANANRPECQSSYTQTNQTTQANTGQIPSYCQTAANASRPECQGSSYQQTTGVATYPNYCYQSQYSTRTECQGLYGTTTTQTTQGRPEYCNYAQYQNRTECLGSTYQQATTSSYPDYCYQSQYSTRTECQGLYGTTTTQTTQGRPEYCNYAQYQNRTECLGSTYQQTTTANTYPDYCYQSQYSTRTECAGLYGTTPVVVATPVTQTTPNYCAYAEYQFRPECQSQVTPVTVLSPTTQLPAYCATPANQYLAACQQTTTTPTTSAYPAYCQTPANQSRPECQGSTTPTVSTVTPQPCQAGIYIANCVNVPVARPCIAGIYDPLCTNTNTTPVAINVTVPAPPTAPINCPTGTGGDNCVDSSDFALPVPPAPLSCQQNSVNNPLAIRDYCSAIFFTHTGAYANASAVATIQRFQQFSFLLRSPYAGHAYIFSRSIDGSIQLLLPNQQIPEAVDVKLYQQVDIPRDVNTFGTNYSLTLNSPISEIFYVVLTQPVSTNAFINITNDQVLQNILLNLGLIEGIYHGIAGSPVQVIN